MADIKKLPLFVRCVIQNFPFIEEDFDALTNYQLISKVVEYLNKIITSQNEVISLSNDLQDAFIQLQTYVNTYFDNLDVQEEINNKLDEMAEDGTLENIISRYINVIPVGNTINLRRIGRKINFGTNPESGSYDSDGASAMMQGGVKISDSLVAYALWDNNNADLNKNRIVIMNINTGEVLRYADYTLGWCNSMAFHNGKIYLAIRGITSGGVSTNSGVIKVINPDTLLIEDTITMDFNVNAIASDGDNLYMLQENSGNIYVYDTTLEQVTSSFSISLGNITYNQDICVDDNFIYLLSTQPSPALSVYNKTTHDLVRIYNTPKYANHYFTGELQWIDITEGIGILGTSVSLWEEKINQFFTVNLLQNCLEEAESGNAATTLQVDSDVTNYNPDGTDGNKFTTVNEALLTDYSLIIIRGNSKSYRYTNVLNKNRVRIEYCTFNEGLNIQYSKAYIDNCTLNYTNNTTYTGCLYIRYSEIELNSVTFNCSNNNYAIQDAGYTVYKFIQPTFTNLVKEVFSTSIATSVVHLNNGNNIPYMRRTNGIHFNLNATAEADSYNTGDYTYSTNLTETQITQMITNAKYFYVRYRAFTKAADEYAIFENKKNTTASDYTINSSNLSGTQTSLKNALCLLKVKPTGYTIAYARCMETTDTGSDIISEPVKNDLIKIKEVGFTD